MPPDQHTVQQERLFRGTGASPVCRVAFGRSGCRSGQDQAYKRLGVDLLEYCRQESLRHAGEEPTPVVLLPCTNEKSADFMAGAF